MIPKTLVEWSFERIQELCSTGLGESHTHDFKLALQDSKNTSKICCAFANSFGGFLVFGIRQRNAASFFPEGVIADNEFSAKLRQRIRAEPHIEVSLPKLIRVSGSEKYLYVFAIPQSIRRPHVPSVSEERFFWKRSNSICERMSLEEIRYQMLSYDEKREKLTLLVIDLAAKAERLKRLASVLPGTTLGTVFSFDVVDRVVVEAYAFIKEDRRIIENLERLRDKLMFLNFETQSLNHFLALSYSNQDRARRVDQFTTHVKNSAPFALECISFVQQRLRELHGIENPFGEG